VVGHVTAVGIKSPIGTRETLKQFFLAEIQKRKK
jgi:hypothetical protein